MEPTADFMALIQAGKIEEAHALIAREKVASKFAPTEIRADKAGMATFYKGNRRVVQNAAGEWQLAPKKQ